MLNSPSMLAHEFLPLVREELGFPALMAGGMSVGVAKQNEVVDIAVDGVVRERVRLTHSRAVMPRVRDDEFLTFDAFRDNILRPAARALAGEIEESVAEAVRGEPRIDWLNSNPEEPITDFTEMRQRMFDNKVPQSGDRLYIMSGERESVYLGMKSFYAMESEGVDPAIQADGFLGHKFGYQLHVSQVPSSSNGDENFSFHRNAIVLAFSPQDRNELSHEHMFGYASDGIYSPLAVTCGTKYTPDPNGDELRKKGRYAYGDTELVFGMLWGVKIIRPDWVVGLLSG